MTDTSWLEVDLFSLRRNMQVWRNIVRRPQGHETTPGAPAAAPARLCAVIKADAYGLGAGEIGRCLDQAGIDMLAVYSPGQADELLAHPISRPILVLMPVRTRPETVRLQNALFNGQLHLTVDSPDQLLTVNSLGASYGVQVPIHLSLDTGMSRGGLCPDQLTAVLRRLPRMRHIRLAGIWSHFATAQGDGAFTQQQHTRFMQAIAENEKRIPKGVILHSAATHAALRHPKYHLNMIRTGLGMLGYGLPSWLTDAKISARRNRDGGGPAVMHDLLPTLFDADDEAPPTSPHSEARPFDAFESADGSERITAQAIRLEPIARWRSRLIHVRRYAAGSTVGYGCTAKLTRDSFLGLVPVGYADGYPLSLSNKGCVQIQPRSGREELVKGLPLARPVIAPIVGRVNMDQIIVDLTPDACDGERGSSSLAATSGLRSPLAQVGDLVDVISNDAASPCSLPRLAELAQSSPYEMLCRISPRVPRLYLNTAPSPVMVASDRLKVSVV